MNSKNDYSTLNFSKKLPLSEKVKRLIQLTEYLVAASLNNKHASNLQNLHSEFESKLEFFKPCLLLSKCESDVGRQFSYLLANPTQSSLKDKSSFKKALNKASLVVDELPIHVQHIPLHSGWLGYYAYPNNSIVSEFYYYPWAICLDHITGDFHLLGKPNTDAIQVFELLKQDLIGSLEGDTEATDLKADRLKTDRLKTDRFKSSKFSPAWTQKQYSQAFYKIQDYLKAGDCYQVNLTQPHKASYTGSALETLAPLYSALNPSYGCYFEGRDCELVSVSPERFISIDGSGRLEAKPIKGTIKRSEDPAQDQLYIDELKNSAKNQAENLMIVDLLRNDLSMSAQPNSVKVEKLFELETHPNVHHLVSTISAQLKSDLTPAEAIANAFPGGSITGAPKKRAMEIIDELEAQPRSLYCGSFGYYSDTGNVDFNILIRSVEFRDGEMTCWGGGGITVDSDCEEEYEESLTKVRKIMEVIEQGWPLG